MRVNLPVPIIRKHTLSSVSGKSTSSLSQEGRWKRSINRTGAVPVTTKPAWLLAHRLYQARVAQVCSPSIPLVCLFLLYPPNHSWIPFFYATGAFCPWGMKDRGDFSASLFRFRDGRKWIAANEVRRSPMRPATIDELDVRWEWKYSLAFLRERPVGPILHSW